jgi:hypothetical protein
MENIRVKIEKIEGYLQIINSMKEDCLKKFLNDPLYRVPSYIIFTWLPTHAYP